MTSRLTQSRRHHTRVICAIRQTDAAFMRMRRKILDHAGCIFSTSQQLVRRLSYCDPLIIAIRTRMIIGPCDVLVVRVITNVPRLIRVLVLRIKEVRAANTAESTKRRSQVLVIASRKYSSASFAKACDAFTVDLAQAVSSIDCKEPELVEV